MWQVGLCKQLLKYGEITSIYDVRRKPTVTGALVTAGFNLLRKIGAEASSNPVRARWSGLVMKVLTREELSGRQASAEMGRWADLFDRAMQIEEVKKLNEWASAAVGGWHQVLHLCHPWHQALNLTAPITMSSPFSPFATASCDSPLDNKDDALDDKHQTGGVRKRLEIVAAGQQKKKRTDSREAVLAFQGMYKYVMGEHWWFEASALGPNFDMFLWSILMMRQDMALLMWARLDVPVRSSLLAAALYRKWSLLPNITPHVQMRMRELAVVFETVAVDVQLIAVRHDTNAALVALERKSRLWKGQTAVDLALMGQCNTFLEKCCSNALDYRWSGDLHPYNQSLGLYPSVMVCLVSGGLLAPYLLTFRDAPVAEAVRPPTQRITIPVNSRNSDRNTDRRSEVLENIVFKLQKMQSGRYIDYNAREVRELTSEEVDLIGSGDLAHEDEMTWSEKYNLFFMCPVTIFVIDAMVQIVFNVVCMIGLFHATPSRLEVTGLEIGLATQQMSTTISEVAQAYVDGYHNYFHAGMNWIKMLALAFFWIGFLGICSRTPFALYDSVNGSDEAGGQVNEVSWMPHVVSELDVVSDMRIYLLHLSFSYGLDADMAYSIRCLVFEYVCVHVILSKGHPPKSDRILEAILEAIQLSQANLSSMHSELSFFDVHFQEEIATKTKNMTLFAPKARRKFQII